MPKPMVVRDVMTRQVITLFPEDNLDKIEEGMHRFRFRHLPVVDDGRLVGLVTHRDLLRVAASVLEPGAAEKTRRINDTLFVQDVMQKDVVTAREDMSLLDAGRLMWDQKLGCLPVTSDDRKLVGIVTEADFMKLALALLGG